MPSPKWALGYLRGRITGYIRGNVPLASVATAAKLARGSNVPRPTFLPCFWRLDSPTIPRPRM